MGKNTKRNRKLKETVELHGHYLEREGLNYRKEDPAPPKPPIIPGEIDLDEVREKEKDVCDGYDDLNRLIVKVDPDLVIPPSTRHNLGCLRANGLNGEICKDWPNGWNK